VIPVPISTDNGAATGSSSAIDPMNADPIAIQAATISPATSVTRIPSPTGMSS
jgi:hypothetical protein